MDLSLLATLKQKLLEAKEFADVWRYFLDHFGDKPEFIALGERVEEHPMLDAACGEIGVQILQKPVHVHDLLLTRITEHSFIHGGGVVHGRLANVLFFEDIGVGMMAVVTFTSPETRFARFSTLPLPAWGRSRN